MRAVLTDRRPHVIINCAAYAAVDRTEVEPDAALGVNADAVGEMAEIGAALVTFSTDHVFDGTKGYLCVESDRPSPLDVYGVSKSWGSASPLLLSPVRWWFGRHGCCRRQAIVVHPDCELAL